MNVTSLPVPIGLLSRNLVADCVRKWAAGAALDERERAVVDQALVQNRVEAIQAVFAERGRSDA
jgi:hypothetical protein